MKSELTSRSVVHPEGLGRGRQARGPAARALGSAAPDAVGGACPCTQHPACARL